MKKLLVLALVCGGCSPFVDVVDVHQVAPAERVAARHVALVPLGEALQAPVQLVGPVEAWSCKAKLWDAPASEMDAAEQLKIKARRLGANAIIDYACDDRADALSTNCWSSVSCGGMAVVVSSR